MAALAQAQVRLRRAVHCAQPSEHLQDHGEEEQIQSRGELQCYTVI